MKRPHLIFGLIAVGAVAVLDPGPAGADAPLTLAAAQALALANHPLIRGAALDVEAARQAVVIAQSPLYPQVEASAVQSFARAGARIGSAGLGITDPSIIQRGSLGIEVSQLVTDFGQTESETEASRADLQAQVSQGELTRDQVLLAVSQAYYAALDTAGLTEVAQQTLHQRQILFDQVSALARAKLKSSLDVSIAAGDLDQARQFLIDATAQHESALATLSQTLGYTDYHGFSLAAPASVPRLAESLGT